MTAGAASADAQQPDAPKPDTGRGLFFPALRLAVPSTAENLLESSVYLIDALMLARVGEPELAAVSLTGVLLWRITGIVASVQIGAAAFVARRWGEGNFAEARAAATHGVLLGFLIGIGVLCVVGPLLPLILYLIGARDGMIPLAVGYTFAVLCAFPFLQTLISLAMGMRAAGDTRTPLLATILINVLNVVLNYMLIYGHFGAPKLGLLGAGIATGLAIAAGSIFLVLVATRGVRPKRLFRVEGAEAAGQSQGPDDDPDRPTFRLVRAGLRPFLPQTTRSIFRVAMPSALEEVIISIGFLGFYRMIASFGTTAMAAHSAVSRIESFSYNAGAGFSVSSSTLVGQSLGAGKPETAKRAFSICSLFAIVLMGSFGILYAAFPETFISMFNPSPAMLAIAIPLLLIVAVEQPVLGTTMTLSGGLRGAGDTLSPTIAQFCGTLVVRLGVGYWLAYPMGLGIAGLYWATLVDWSLRTLILTYFVWRGRWCRVRV